MYFLGISGGVMPGNQDGAAAIYKGGTLVAAAEEERFLQIKHAAGLLPTNAIKFCLDYAGISIKDVSRVSFAGKTYKNFQKILSEYFLFNFGYHPNITLVDHHLAHAFSSFYLSGFQESLILTMDFSGDRTSTMASYVKDGKIEEIYRIKKPNSLGFFYSMLTQYLGFQKDNDEYKVMGLSAYGNPSINLKGLLSIKNGTYQLNQAYIRDDIAPNMPSPSRQERIYRDNIALNRPGRIPGDKIDIYHKNVAASGQKALEEAVLLIINNLVDKTGIRNLCLSGGVALNCVLNQRIRESGLIDSLFTPYSVSDAGLSIGGAMMLASSENFTIKRQKSPYLGPEFSEDEIEKILNECHISYSRPNDISAKIAFDISEGKIAGWFQGKMEFGARALGNRSILADPRIPGMKDRINKLVKFREPFRPMAPSVLKEKAGLYFKGISSSPYMTSTYNVKTNKQQFIPSVTHIDGTARVQTVDKKLNPLFHKLISEFEKITGVPAVLNTSLNIRGKPISCSPRHALETFYATGMDVLALGPFYLKK